MKMKLLKIFTSIFIKNDVSVNSAIQSCKTLK